MYEQMFRIMLELVPIGFKGACDFIRTNHRHHNPPQGMKFCLAVAIGGQIVGVAVTGRPISRHLDDGRTLEVTRVCTDGTENVCSKLYSASWRVAREMVYKRLITYILYNESGISLKASGWICQAPAGGGNWNKPGRQRTDSKHEGLKWRYSVGDQTGEGKEGLVKH
jgi:hypothetical protein